MQMDDHTLEVVDEFTYLGSTISMNPCLDTEISKRIGKASSHATDKSACLPSMHPQHATIWQRDVDDLHVPGMWTKHLLHVLPEAYPGHQVAGPYTQQ